MASENQLETEAQRLEEEAMRKLKANPLSEEALRKLPEVARTLHPSKLPHSDNGHSIYDLPFSPEKQSGLQWRLRIQNRVRTLFDKGADYEWVVWNMMRSMAITETTAKRIIEDALRQEPPGRPK